jgi:short-subunit dehydrogenase
MIAQDSDGHIVNTASLSGLISMPYGAPYNVSKFGVVALTEALYYELIVTRSKLRASVLCPAWVRTSILEAARNRSEEYGSASSPALEEKFLASFRSQLEQGLKPEAVAERVFEAVRDEQLYIWTHPEYKDFIQRRHEDVLQARNPDVSRLLA